MKVKNNATEQYKQVTWIKININELEAFRAFQLKAPFFLFKA